MGTFIMKHPALIKKEYTWCKRVSNDTIYLQLQSQNFKFSLKCDENINHISKASQYTLKHYFLLKHMNFFKQRTFLFHKNHSIQCHDFNSNEKRPGLIVVYIFDSIKKSVLKLTLIVLGRSSLFLDIPSNKYCL